MYAHAEQTTVCRAVSLKLDWFVRSHRIAGAAVPRHFGNIASLCRVGSFPAYWHSGGSRHGWGLCKVCLESCPARPGCGLVSVSSAEPTSFFSRCRFCFPRKPRPISWLCTRLPAGPLCPLHPPLQTGVRPNRGIDAAVCNRKFTVCRRSAHFL